MIQNRKIYAIAWVIGVLTIFMMVIALIELNELILMTGVCGCLAVVGLYIVDMLITEESAS